MRRLFFLAVLILSVLVTWPASAQTPAPTPVVECKPADVITKAAALRTTSDTKKDMDALNTLAADIQAVNVACNGWRFSGQGNKVLGPFTLSPALYKVTVKTKTDLTLDLQSIAQSDCGGTGNFKYALLTLTKGQADNGAESALDVRFGCRAVLVTSNSKDLWTITVEPLK